MTLADDLASRVSRLVESFERRSSDHGPAPKVDALLEALGALAREIEALPHDVQGLSALAAEEGFERFVEDAHMRVVALTRELVALRTSTAPSVARYLLEQTRRRDIGKDARKLKLNVTGHASVDGWLNVGSAPADIVTNLLWPLPLPDACADRVYFALAIEHFYLEDAATILRELHRVLEPGGVIRVVTTDMERYLRSYAEQDTAFFAAQEAYWPWTRGLAPLEQILAWAGGDRTAGTFDGHKWGFDFETLRSALERAGFGSVVRSGFMQSQHADLRVDTTSHDAGFTHRDVHFALFVEATAQLRR